MFPGALPSNCNQLVNDHNTHTNNFCQALGNVNGFA